ncbi:hypothetical protein MNBD_GAMMA01-1904 [hydrothermal vent metagenome]|uniref:TonB C-terminal domain-containing protein n=1 Tax=hydrothermal vent metagenome TaxID=652676 RepID=A0A3B0VRE1_9ZZZZ
MNSILLIALLFYVLTINAQSDSSSTENRKPSWSDGLPKRRGIPSVNFADDIDAGIDLDMGDFGMDRNAIMESDDEVTSEERDQGVRYQGDSPTQELELVEDIAEQENLKKQARLVEAAKIAEQENLEKQARLVEAAKIVAQEKQMEEQRLVEQQKLVVEKQKADAKLAAEKLAAETMEIEQANQNKTNSQLEDIVVSAPVEALRATTGEYPWLKIKHVLPIYPTKAAREKKEGWVEVELTLGSDGYIASAKVVKSHKNSKVFNKAALKAVTQWQYEPPINYGIEESQVQSVRIIFEL